MTTVLDKELKRRISVDGAEYTVIIDPDGLRIVGKGKRKPDAALRWRDLLSGDAALAAALNASISGKPAGAEDEASGGSPPDVGEAENKERTR